MPYVFGGQFRPTALVDNVHLTDLTHDYGPAKRQAAYRFITDHFGLTLDADKAFDERPNAVLPADDLMFGLGETTTATDHQVHQKNAASFFAAASFN